MQRVNIGDQACVRRNSPQANTRNFNLDTIKVMLAGSDVCGPHAEKEVKNTCCRFAQHLDPHGTLNHSTDFV